MKKELYRVFYYINDFHNGVEYRKLEKKIIIDTIENIKKKYRVALLTDSCGNVIMDNIDNER